MRRRPASARSRTSPFLAIDGRTAASQRSSAFPGRAGAARVIARNAVASVVVSTLLAGCVRVAIRAGDESDAAVAHDAASMLDARCGYSITEADSGAFPDESCPSCVAYQCAGEIVPTTQYDA